MKSAGWGPTGYDDSLKTHAEPAPGTAMCSRKLKLKVCPFSQIKVPTIGTGSLPVTTTSVISVAVSLCGLGIATKALAELGIEMANAHAIKENAMIFLIIFPSS